MLECKKEITLLLSITFDWLKQQKLTKLHGKVRMNIYTVLTNIHITKSRLSLNNTEILCGGHVKLSTFLGFFYNSYKWSKSIKTHTQKNLSKWSLNTFYRINGLSLGLCIVCVKMRTLICGESTLPHNKRNRFPPYRNNYLTAWLLHRRLVSSPCSWESAGLLSESSQVKVSVGTTLRVLNNWGESATFSMTSVNCKTVSHARSARASHARRVSD